MAKQILVPHGKISKLMKAFNTTCPTVRAALRYQTNTDLARKIRHAAVTVFGGAETGK
jgi:hypothetical protein